MKALHISVETNGLVFSLLAYCFEGKNKAYGFRFSGGIKDHVANGFHLY